MNKLSLGAYALLTSLLLITTPAKSQSQPESAETTRGLYLGLQVGTALGQCTFRSLTEHNSRLGFQGGVVAGYHFSRLFSAETHVTIGGQRQGACDCCPYWLGCDGSRHAAPVAGLQGAYYRDLTARTLWQRFALQANFDLLSLLADSRCRWSVTLSPQLSAVHTDTELKTADGRFDTPWADGSQWHLGLGGQLSAGYRISRHVEARVYAGLTLLTGSRFDLIPRHGHKSNQLYDLGLRVAYHL